MIRNLIDSFARCLQEDFVRLPYTEGVKILEEAVKRGHQFEFPVFWGMDLAQSMNAFLVEEHFKSPSYID
jgi:asparaginyl-tRNA synthetase